MREKALSLPRLPGVYLMKDKEEKVIYVGKAKSLKNRVSQYFQSNHPQEAKTRAMVSQVADFEVIVVGTEFEALVLESSLIKRHQPKYNILLKDSKGYPYIRLSLGEPYPKFSLTTHVGKETAQQARYFGPYGSRHNTQAIIDALRSTLALPSCNRKFPRDLGKERPCLNLHMGTCAGHCRFQLGIETHQQSIAQAVALLEGKQQELLQQLTAEMEDAAEALRFEQAGEIRDRLKAIALLSTKQKVVASCLADTDVIGFARGLQKSAFVVLHYYQGELIEKDLELIPTPIEEDEESISALLREYYALRAEMPKEILIPQDIAYESSLSRLFSEQVGHKVTLLTPQRGGKVEILGLAEANAKEELERITTKEEKEQKILVLLGKTLGIDPPPYRIESYDISNTGASHIVASMVVFENGKKKPSAYRKFKINDLDHPDDYASMAQVLTRRLEHLLEGDEKFGSKPDLLLIDGGLEHLRVAQKVMRQLKLSIPAFGMVKDNRHRTRALIAPTAEEIGIFQHPSLFSFIGQIQEETHRVAITFHKQQQSKALKKSVLDQVGGVGEARKKALMKEFKSIKAMKQASLEELQAVVPQKVALAVYDFLQGNTQEQTTDNTKENAT